MATFDLKHQSVEVPGEPVPNETPIRRSPWSPDRLATIWDEKILTLFDSFQATLAKSGDKEFLGTLVTVENKPTYRWQTYNEVWARAQAFGAGLVRMGLEPGDRVGIYCPNQAEWVITEYACYTYSLIPVALYDTLGADAVNYVVGHAEVSVVVCTPKTQANVLKIDEALPLKRVIVVGGDVDGEIGGRHVIPFAGVEASGRGHPLEPRPPQPTDLATIMYTSGSTGNPKGVQLLHSTFIAEVAGLRLHEGGGIFSDADIHMSYLPLAHSFERAVHGILISVGGKIGFYGGNVASLFDDIAVLRPTFLVGAPRVWQRLQEKMLVTIEKAGFLKKLMFKKALQMKTEYLDEGDDSTPILDSLVFDKTKERIGGRVRFIMSGAAPLDPKLARFLKACFICPILQGYGLTETCAGAFVTALADKQVGHVGYPLGCTEVKLESVPEMKYLAEEGRGEICLRGPNIFTGYFKDPEKTAEDLREDGWLHTGDIGRFNDDGTLSIIDRKKNIFKLAQGEYVAAEYLEQVYSRAAPVSQIFVYGDSFNSYLVAVIVPNLELLQGPAEEAGLQGPVRDQLQSPAVYRAVTDALTAEAKAAKLHGFEFIKHFYLESQPFTIENNLLTPSFKPRRPDLKVHYQAVIERLYAEAKEKMGF